MSDLSKINFVDKVKKLGYENIDTVSTDDGINLVVTFKNSDEEKLITLKD